MYLHQTSNHPRATKENIAYGLALRSRPIFSSENDYEESKRNIEKRLIARGHQQNVIRDKLSKADSKIR